MKKSLVCVFAIVALAAWLPEPAAAQERWVPASGGRVPPGSFAGGGESGQTLYVCRASHRGGVHPGKVVGANCNIGWGGQEILVRNYEVLQDSKVLLWATGGRIPANAVAGGRENGKPLYVCRGQHGGGTHPGKVVAGNCNIGWGGREILLGRYQVLTRRAVAAAATAGPSIDTGYYYRLTNTFLGAGRSLDTYGNSHEPYMGETGNYSGQLWRLTPLGGGTYRLTNTFLGKGKSLDTYNHTHELFMGQTGNYSGQRWRLTPLGDGTYRLTNAFLGEKRSLDTYGDTHEPFMGETGNYSGQRWKLTPVRRISN